MEEEREIAIRPARNLPLRLSSAQGTISRTLYLLPCTVTKPITDQKDPKEIGSRDTKLTFLRTSSKVEFTQSIPFHSHPHSALLARAKVPFRRSWFKPIPRCKRESSPRNVPAGGTPPQKGVQQFSSRDARVGYSWLLWKDCNMNFTIEIDCLGLGSDCFVEERSELV